MELRKERRRMLADKAGQVDQVSRGGRGLTGGISAAARDLGLPRKAVERAVKVAALAPEAKAEARKRGVAGNQSALLEAANKTVPKSDVSTSQRATLVRCREVKDRLLMLLHDAVAETAFSELIDARFPYHDAAAASELITRGWAVSLNAAFNVLYELCLPPRDANVSEQQLLRLIDDWRAGPDHPIKEPVLSSAIRRLGGEDVSWQEAVDLMERIGQYDGQRAALAIVSRAAYSPSPEAEAAVYNAEEAVRQAWDRRGC